MQIVMLTLIIFFWIRKIFKQYLIYWANCAHDVVEQLDYAVDIVGVAQVVHLTRNHKSCHCEGERPKQSESFETMIQITSPSPRVRDDIEICFLAASSAFPEV